MSHIKQANEQPKDSALSRAHQIYDILSKKQSNGQTLSPIQLQAFNKAKNIIAQSDQTHPTTKKIDPPTESSPKSTPKPSKKKIIVWIIIILIGLMILIGIFSQDDTPTNNDTQTAQNTSVDNTTKTITETSDIPFKTERQEDNSLTKGTEKTMKTGINGVKTTTYKVTYDSNGKEISREKIKDEITIAPVDEIIAVGIYVAPALSDDNDKGLNSNSTPAATPSQAQQKFANCSELNEVYPHGIGKDGAKDHVSTGSAPVTNYTVNDALYDSLNGNFDRDKDGIACEA